MSATDRPVAGARERARIEVRREIMASANRQVAATGAAALSLRAVARDLGMVSSALYRYFPSRDALLTALIIEAYDSLGELTESVAGKTAGEPACDRWIAAAMAIRSWAVKHPHDYALVYGSPVPGYAAPTDTVVPGTRVTRALVGIVSDAHDARQLTPRQAGTPITIGETTRRAFDALRRELDMSATDDVIMSVIAAWTQLFGLLSFELFGQTKGLIEDHEAFFRESATLMGSRIGLPTS